MAAPIYHLWLSILFSNQTYTHPLSKEGLWPIICSTKGCVTTTSWHKHYQARTIFAQRTDQEPPTPEEALTTLARQLLVNKAKDEWPVNMRDAHDFRQEVLRTTDENKIKETTGLTIEEYDKYVVLPLLKQEILRSQLQQEDFESLFQHLADKQTLWVLPRNLIWDSETATVIKK